MYFIKKCSLLGIWLLIWQVLRGLSSRPTNIVTIPNTILMLHIVIKSFFNCSANEEYLLPLIARIKQLDVDIAEKHDKINDLRIIIHKNASRIDKLLSSGSL